MLSAVVETTRHDKRSIWKTMRLSRNKTYHIVQTRIVVKFSAWRQVDPNSIKETHLKREYRGEPITQSFPGNKACQLWCSKSGISSTVPHVCLQHIHVYAVISSTRFAAWIQAHSVIFATHAFTVGNKSTLRSNLNWKLNWEIQNNNTNLKEYVLTQYLTSKHACQSSISVCYS